MSNLLKYIEQNNDTFFKEVIKIIKNDKYWLSKLGIIESNDNENLKIAAIKKEISNPENKLVIDELLKYVIADYLIEYDSIPLIKHSVSAGGYGRKSALFVFKCDNLYFCYYFGDKLVSLITEHPEEFCFNAAKSIRDYYKLEESNLDDEWFEETDCYNDLQCNFQFD